jgi:hypothetical protein
MGGIGGNSSGFSAGLVSADETRVNDATSAAIRGTSGVFMCGKAECKTKCAALRKP